MQFKFICSLQQKAVSIVLTGAKVFEKTCVTKVICDGDRVAAVETNRGKIECSYFVNCGGFWAREVGKMSNPVVKVPLQACEHYYLHTKEIEGLDPMTPAVRDLDGYIYFREYNGKLLCGGFEPEAKPAFEDGALPGTIATFLGEDSTPTIC